ncbi:hypothetical protein HNP84_002296 [Thermocatellispora tengchongensis]|uniref:Uncharacterized protein n=1 Tax=Thermocatellispora tengchongensis TaxID=1073253 RepID=A0A840P521_9ACTN|nr:hypothetical protein [Thermocatellispora tengchongensis]MBB5132580.1 hypothetical protein [Thermocatellispora tengchongensis]
MSIRHGKHEGDPKPMPKPYTPPKPDPAGNDTAQTSDGKHSGGKK